MALDFPNNVANYLSVTSAAELNFGTDAFTVFCLASFDGTNRIDLFSKVDGGTSNIGFFKNVNETVQIFTRRDSVDSTLASSATVAIDGSWVFLAATRRASTGELAVMVDETYSQSGSLTVRNLSDANTLQIGRNSGGSFPHDGRMAWTGWIKGHEATQDQLVAAKYNPLSCLSWGGTVSGLWPMFDQTVVDISGNQNNATINGTLANASGPPVAPPFGNDNVLSFPIAAAGGHTATSAITLAAATIAATANSGASATSSISMLAATIAATAEEAFTATSAFSLVKAELAATGETGFTATSAMTLVKASLATSGNTGASATSVINMIASELSASGLQTVGITGTASLILAAFSLSASGSLPSAIQYGIIKNLVSNLVRDLERPLIDC